MANEQNLQKFTSEQSREEASKNGKKGGIASGEARRKKANMRERLLEILDMPLKKGKIQGFENIADAADKNLTAQDAILLVALKKALKGDMRAIDFLRDTSGNKLFGEPPTTENDARDRLKETVEAINRAVKKDGDN